MCLAKGHACGMARPARLKADRTACINRVRGLLAEFGLVFAQGPSALEAVLSDTLEDASNEMNTLARLCVQQAQTQWRELDNHITWCDERIAAHAKGNPAVKKAATLMCIGPVGRVGGRGNGGRLQAVPACRAVRGLDRPGAVATFQRRQEQLGRHLPKRGDNYLRSLLIQGAKSAVITAHKRSDPISLWVTALRERAGWQKAAVALANKNARILWAVMTKGDAFDSRHVSVKPGAPVSAPAST